jgi:hypothetical protein
VFRRCRVPWESPPPQHLQLGGATVAYVTREYSAGKKFKTYHRLHRGPILIQFNLIHILSLK